MKKLIVISTMAVFLSSMAAQAQTTFSWDFDTLGDTEGWEPSHLDSTPDGLIVTNGNDGIILTTPNVAANDPGLELSETNSVPVDEYWDKLIVRARALDGNASYPIEWFGDSTVVVVNWVIIDGPIGTPGSNWDTVTQSNHWIVSSLDITIIGTNDLWYLRVDPPINSALTSNFEFDYIQVTTHTNAPPPPVYKTAWEFNTPGDLEGWQGGDVTGLQIATASTGESVMTVTGAGEGDPQVGNYSDNAYLEPGHYWSVAEVRIRQLMGTDPQVWDVTGTLFLLNNMVLSANGGGTDGIGGSDWDTTFEADGWITTRLDISAVMPPVNLFNMRIDPFHAAGGRIFEVDYVRFETRTSPVLPAAPLKLIHTWEFNTMGDTEDWTDNGDIVGLTASSAFDGSGEGVLTCADVTGDGDSMLFYNDLADPALNITPPGAWSMMGVRMRQLDGNPGDAGTLPIDPLDGTQIIFVANGNVVVNLGTEIVSFTNEPGGWVTALLDISRVGFVDLTRLRIDAVGSTTNNFEIDFVQVFSQGSKYDAWSQVVHGLVGADALTTADPDGDTFNNLYEFAFDGVPTDSNNVGFVESSIVDDGGTSYVEYNYVRRIDSNNGLQYGFEQKGALSDASWTALGDTAEVGTQLVGDDHEMVTNRVEAVDAVKFHRATVTGE